MASRSNRVLSDHEEIRRWAEERNAAPACVRGTGGSDDIGMLRLDFPGYSGQQSLEHIDWDDWFRKFDERKLSLLVQDHTAGGERTNFNKLVSRATANAARSGRSRSPRKASATRGRAVSRSRTTAGKTSRSRTAARKKSATKKKSAPAKKRATRSTRSTAAKRSSRTLAGSRSKTKTRSSATTRASASSRSKRSTSSRKQASERGRATNRGKVRSISSGRSKSHVLTDHDEIRRWAEDRNAAPACVRGTGSGDDPGMIRLDFPGFSGADSLEHIGWDKWFRAFDDNSLALLVQDSRAGGGRSNFNKLIGRETAGQRARGNNKASRRHPEKAATSRTRASGGNRSTNKADRGSTRARRTESARGRTGSHRRAA